LVSQTVPLKVAAMPPVPTPVLPLMVQFVSVAVAVARSTRIPPAPALEELPLMVQFVNVAVPRSRTPVPMFFTPVAGSPPMVQSSRVSAAFWLMVSAPVTR
jgi:hypothetical protein